MIRLPVLIALVAAFAPLDVRAQVEAVVLSSKVEVERSEAAPDGSARVALKAPAEVNIVPGDRLRVTLEYANRGAAPAAGFVATNPLPAAVAFEAAGEDWADVSVDGGRSFGRLAALTVEDIAADGTKMQRPALPADVTHIRWAFARPIASGESGTLSYRGVVK